MKPSPRKIEVCARPSKLSQVQVWEVEKEVQAIDPIIRFYPLWVNTRGDKDKTTSLVSMEKTDFFTKELDELLLQGVCRIAIHSAKDLPDELPSPLTIVAITKGLSSRDLIVTREKTLPKRAKIGTSSARRMEMLEAFRGDLRPMDIRGNIEERLAMLDKGEYDGIVIAECALQRLQVEGRPYTVLGEGTPGQGKLAVVARAADAEMQELFSGIDEKSSLSRERPGLLPV